MLETVKNAFKIKDIRSKLIFTLLMLIVVRLGCELPVPGVDRNYFANWFAQQTGDAFSFMDAFVIATQHRTFSNQDVNIGCIAL